MSRKASLPKGRLPRKLSRNSGPTSLGAPESPFSSDTSWSEDDDALLSYSTTHRALQASNDDIKRKIAKLRANTVRLRREMFLLQRHVRDFEHPVFETWEADILTRLIEIAHAYQRRKLPQGVSIGENNSADRESLSHAYTIASKQVQEGTLRRLGLSPKYGEALLRYEEIVMYRSPNPFQTESQFARWLLNNKETMPEKFEFWAKLFPICYGRTVQQSILLK